MNQVKLLRPVLVVCLLCCLPASAQDRDTMFLALSYAKRQGWQITRYETSTIQEPGYEWKATILFIGPRRIVVSNFKRRVNGQTVSSVELEESIGATN